MTTKTKALSRIDIRRRHDKATNAVVLEYVGRGLRFVDHIYGYPEGVFFVAALSELPLPPKLIALSEELGVQAGTCDAERDLRAAVVEALVAGAMLEAPRLLADIAEPCAEWKPWDQRELERKHAVALAHLTDRVALMEREMRLRAAPPTFRWPARAPERRELAPPDPQEREPHGSASRAPVAGPPFAALPVAVVEIPSLPSGATVSRIEPSIHLARESELPQRLPGGARRHLAKMVRAQYVVRGAGVPESRTGLAEAMRDAEKIAAAEAVEVTVIDWDGEWPVVVRRYGDGGRTIYRVEDALRRAGVSDEGDSGGEERVA